MNNTIKMIYDADTDTYTVSLNDGELIMECLSEKEAMRISFRELLGLSARLQQI